MLKGDLNDFVLSFEQGDGGEMSLWVSVPGSMVSGTLVSHRHMVRKVTESMLEKASITDQALMSIQTDKLDEYEREYSRSVSSVESAHLVDVTIFQGDKIFRSSLAVINLDAVGAWGIGTFRAAQAPEQDQSGE